MPRVLLLGGTGAIGRYVQQSCLKRGYTVAVTTRRDHPAAGGGITYINGNARDKCFVTDLLHSTRFDAIVDFMVYGTSEFRDRVSGILERTEHYVFVSSYRVFADTAGASITERTPRLLDVSQDGEYLSSDEYALAKARQENILRAQPLRNWTIVRPSITYADNRLQFGCLEAISFLPRVAEGLPVVIPEKMLERRTTMTWAGDAAEMITSLLLNPAALASDFNVTSSEYRSWREIGEIYRNLIELQWLPVSLRNYLSLGVNRYQVIYDRMFDRICDNRKICDLTGIDPSAITTPEVGLRRALASTNLGTIPLSRMQGRMDALIGVTRLMQAKSSREAASYAVGHTSVLNRLALRAMSKRYTPPFRD